jgi:hypothetical protein
MQNNSAIECAVIMLACIIVLHEGHWITRYAEGTYLLKIEALGDLETSQKTSAAAIIDASKA